MDEVTRRRLLTGVGAAGITGLAGCTGLPGGDDTPELGPVGLADFRGSGALVQGRAPPGGPSIEDMPSLSGTLSLYLGGGESGLYRDLFGLFEAIYDDFELTITSGSSASLATQIVDEYEANALGGDVFLPVDAGSMGVAAEAGATQPLPSELTTRVPAQFRGDDGTWVGVEGRARAVPYNTETLTEDDIPQRVLDFPDTQALQGTMGWAPTYGAFQSFVTAMRLLQGRSRTKEWLESMINIGTESYRNEFFVSQFVADGTLSAGFANHYYALRVRNANPDAPLALAFTSGGAGALVNVSCAGLLANTDRSDLAVNFIRHLLSAEAQEYFATVTNGYPMIEGVEPLAGLPTIRELNPPDIDLTQLADLTATIDLLEEVGLI
ncbi:MAG: extracellular solute-binding protein [Halobacteriaceae archaeon]